MFPKTIKQYFTFAIICGSLFSSGCNVGGELQEKDRNKIMECIDTRDGETFRFNTNTIYNERIGLLSPTSFDFTTLDGRRMTLNSNMEAWIKCSPKQ